MVWKQVYKSGLETRKVSPMEMESIPPQAEVWTFHIDGAAEIHCQENSGLANIFLKTELLFTALEVPAQITCYGVLQTCKVDC